MSGGLAEIKKNNLAQFYNIIQPFVSWSPRRKVSMHVFQKTPIICFIAVMSVM